MSKLPPEIPRSTLIKAVQAAVNVLPDGAWIVMSVAMSVPAGTETVVSTISNAPPRDARGIIVISCSKPFEPLNPPSNES